MEDILEIDQASLKPSFEFGIALGNTHVSAEYNETILHFLILNSAFMPQPLRVFLCHSKNDAPAVRELHHKLLATGWIKPWLDEEDLFPGQDWNMEIEQAIEETHVILVCLSQGSVTKEGYVQKEIRIALDYADYKPEGTLFIIPVKLEECQIPKRLVKWQYAGYIEGKREREFERLLVSLKRRAESLGIETNPITTAASVSRDSNPTSVVAPKTSQAKSLTYNGMEFMRVPAGKFLMGDESEQHAVDIPYDYFMARFPVTNEQFNAYVQANGIKHPVSDWQNKKNHPVESVSWDDAMAYCKWFNQTFKSELGDTLLRLPTEAEWEKAARWKLPSPFGGGAGGEGESLEYPWGNTFDKNKCNSSEGKKCGTTPVGFFPAGDSPFGCADMAGNAWEWTHSLYKPYPYKDNDGREDESSRDARALRGGSWRYSDYIVRSAYRYNYAPSVTYIHAGFRCARFLLP